MSLFASDLVAAASRRDPLALVASALSSRWLGFGMVAAAIASQALSHHNGDNSWLFTVAEKVLDGARPYVDVVESNPPAAFMIYAPAIFFARLAHVSVEFAASAFVFLCCAASVWLTGRIAADAGLIARRERGFLLNAAIFSLVLMPGFSFAEREHVACLFVLPMLAVYWARAEAAAVAIGMAIAAGLAAGLAMAIKPHFALALALPFFYALARRRAVALLVAPENLVAAAAILANIALVVWCFPGYFTLSPITLDVYVPLREPWSWLLVESWFLLNLALLAGAALVARSGMANPRLAIPALASAGFLATYLIQGKGWVNHGLPGVELAFLVVALALAPVFCAADAAAREVMWARARRPALFLFFPVVIGAPILFGVFLGLTGYEEYRGLTAAVIRHAPKNPKIIALSPRLDVGHPLTRRVGGEWVGRPNALWMMIFSQMFIDARWGDDAWRARLATYLDRDARGFREDVEARRPDIVLVLDDARIEKAMRHPDIAAALAAYEPVDSADGVTVWMRRHVSAR